MMFFLHESGSKTKEIAEHNGISESYCRKLINRGLDFAAEWSIPSMIVMMNGVSGKPGEVTCKHGKPITAGQPLNCLDCGVSGFDFAGRMQIWQDPPPPTRKFKPKLPNEEKFKLKPGERELGTAYTAMDWIVALPDGNKYQIKAGKASEAKAQVATMLYGKKGGPNGSKPKSRLPRGTIAFRPIDQPTRPPERKAK
jgi:hypothetical protein